MLLQGLNLCINITQSEGNSDEYILEDLTTRALSAVNDELQATDMVSMAFNRSTPPNINPQTPDPQTLCEKSVVYSQMIKLIIVISK